MNEMPSIFPGWYIKVSKRSKLSKAEKCLASSLKQKCLWEVIFYDGLEATIIFPTELTLTKEAAEYIAQNLLEEICKTILEDCKQTQPEIFKRILSDPKKLWRTYGPMGDIQIGLIAQKLYLGATLDIKK